MKITQSQLKQIIKEELEALAQEGCGGPFEPDEPEVVDLAGMNADDAYGFAIENAIDALRRSGMEDAASLLEVDVVGARTSLGEPHETQGDLREEEKWIQGAEEDIERRGTEGVCTGDKFGGPTCRPGTKRYNLAKTFRKMVKKRKED